ncbi:MAG: DUF3465 domain-containing protein [Gammaproteobacteria bacterium]|nr:DUF3465 domain-containing protein [Gammaproteobacteria bacterium]
MKFLPFVVALLIAVLSYQRSSDDASKQELPPSTPVGQDHGSQQSSDAELARAFEERLTAHQVLGRGTVERVLSDDNDGSRHQRFVVRLASGQSLMIAHNIDLAPRVASLQKGDYVSFYGEYEWNQQGGVIHWTHNDPQGSHVAGWLEHNGQRYQ